jgi:1-acyl-sn-glycerol-3-phosphate acyltransferase
MTLFFRKVYVILVIFLPVAIGGLISIGCLYFMKGEISAIALGMGSVLLGITVDYSLHIFTHYRTTKSVKLIYQDLTLPLVLSCLITASSFLCLLFVKSRALNDLGLFAAISVVNALIAALLILPHFLSSRKSGNNENTGGMAVLERFISYRFDRSKILISVIVVITIASFFTSKNVQFETDMMKLNYVSESLYKAEKNLYKISNHALKSIYVVGSGKNIEEALIANEKIEGIVNGLKDQAVVKAASGVGDFIISEQLQNQRIQQWNRFWTPDKKAKLKSLLIQGGQKYKFRENAFEPFFALLDKEFTTVSAEDNQTLKDLLFNDFISEKSGLSTVATLIKVDDDQKEKVYAAFPDSENITVIDRRQITSRFVELMRDDFNTLEFLSLGLVFVVLILCYGRIELGLIAFIPMVLSWLWTIGIMGFLGIKFNILNIIISTFILGLGIDYSIFIMSGLIEEYKKGIQHLASFKTSIFLSAFTSISGIGALIFADHPALKSIAVLSIIGMCSVITISYTIQPLLFRKLITDRTEKGLHPYTAKSLFLTIFAYSYFLFGCLVLSLLAIVILPVFPAGNAGKKKFFHRVLSLFCRSMIYIMTNVKKVVINPLREDFSKPAVVICNHQSFLDILLTVMLSPKIILVTNDWVWNSPFFGRVVKYADFFPASKGMEEGLEGLEQRVRDGYSIVIFPEGTRSADGKIGRFHKGAFFLAEKLKLDILPLLLHGTGDTITKGDFLLKDGQLTVKFLPRIRPQDVSFGDSYQERTKLISKYFKTEFEILQKEIETPAYFRSRLISNYIYKGPVLEWYMRIKTGLENNYKFFDSVLPAKGKIVDIGCGYGFLPYMLHFLSKDRQITGLDYDEEKIGVASKCFSKSSSLEFIACDVTTFELPQADAFVIADVLHYFPVELQDRLIEQCLEKLSDDGVLLIRDGNSDIEDRHKGTKLTEFFSIKVLKFNKSVHQLSYISGKHLQAICRRKNIDVEIVDNAKLTSNTYYIIRKSKVAVPV